MSRWALAMLLVVLPACLAACGGGDESSSGSAITATRTGEVDAPPWAAKLLRRAGPEGAAILASSDFAVGRNRLKFLLVRGDGSLIQAPSADVFHQPRAGAPTVRTSARLVSFGVSGVADENARSFYAASLNLPAARRAWIVIQPKGVAYQGFQLLNVKREPAAIGLGERAPASVNPTVASKPAKRITTARPPDTELLRHTVADSLERHIPFVVAFATPAFCQSRTCGPTVEVVDAVRRRYERRGVRFIHIEIYEDNLPGNGVNQWVREWRLPSEPWVFVVDGSGTVRDRFEGALSVGELDRSVHRYLLG